MRFFLPELWKAVNSSDPRTREEAGRRWRENDARYAADFRALSAALPPAVLNAWERHGGFHDWQIRELRFLDGRKTLRLRLSDGETEGVLILRGVSRFRLDVQSFENCLGGRLCWGFGELSRGPSGDWELSVLCDFDNELQFCFTGLDYRERALKNPESGKEQDL